MMCSFPHLLLRKGELSMFCGKDDLASEHTLVWAAFMLFSSQPQRALCVYYCLNYTKSLRKSAIPTIVKHGLGKQR